MYKVNKDCTSLSYYIATRIKQKLENYVSDSET